MEKLKAIIKWIRTEGLLHFLACEDYKKKQEEMWICPNCGYVSYDKQAWEKCPLCEAEQGICQVVIPEELKCW